MGVGRNRVDPSHHQRRAGIHGTHGIRTRLWQLPSAAWPSTPSAVACVRMRVHACARVRRDGEGEGEQCQLAILEPRPLRTRTPASMSQARS